MEHTWIIAQWEIMRNLRNKQFIIGLLITPLIMLMFIGLPRLLERWNQPSTAIYYILNESPEVLEEFHEIEYNHIILNKYSGEREGVESLVHDNEAAGYLVIPRTFLNTGEVLLFYNEQNNEAISFFENLLTQTLQHARLQEATMDSEELAYLTARSQILSSPMEDAHVTESNQIIVAIVFIVLIFFLIFSSGTMLMQSALQERRDRMAEVVLSSIHANQLMAGKIIGHFLLGMLQLAFWLLLGLPIAISLLDFPLLEALSNANLPLILFFLITGYLLFSALFVSIGATMEDLQSAGNSQGLVIMIPMLSFLFIGPVVQNPDGLIAQVASIFPITSPVIMMMRSAITRVSTWEIVSSALLMILSIFLMGRVAAKIFRVGMLMYGKTNTMSEILKWIRYREVE